MNCENCQEQLSELLDGGLAADVRGLVRAHAEECPSCAAVREELSSILSAAQDGREFLVAPPNERALWLRIRNSIEAEAATARAGAEARAGAATAPPGLWSRLATRRWSLSSPQLATVAAGIAVAVALVTATGMRTLLDGRQQRQQEEARAGQQPVIFKQNPDELLMIEYLKRRVEERKARWNPRMSEVYDRNMGVVDTTVEELIRDLNARPHDAVTEEALKSALRDKIEMLKEFSEL
jgi:hypothetical protein